MTAKKLLIITAVAIGLITLIKLIYLIVLNNQNLLIQYVLWVGLALVGIGACRRLGPINYLEALMVILLWLFIAMLVDLMFIVSIAGLDIYKHLFFWISYLIVSVAIFVSHKKRHVEIRRAGKK